MADLVFNNPLTEQHLTMINEGLQKIQEGKRQVALAERAGIDVMDSKASIAESEKKLLAIKQVYFPGR